MSQSIGFYEMFNHYDPPSPIAELLGHAVVVGADINPEMRFISVRLFSQAYLKREILDTVRQDLCAVYGLKKVELDVQYPSELLQDIPPEDLTAFFTDINSLTRGSLAGAEWSWDGDVLSIHLRANGKKEIAECIPKVCRRLSDQFGTYVSIEVHAGKALEGEDLVQAMEQMRANILKDMPKVAVSARAVKTDKPPETIYGKPFRGKTVPMDQLTLDMGFVIVEGRVFCVEHKELPKRNAWVINFDITDDRSSVRISRFMENREVKNILEKVKVGSVVKVQGKLNIDNYSNEMVLKPNAIMSGSMDARRDVAPGEKRVELHMHTIMSNMDALTNTAAAIKQAAAWGHRAIAITDHGCVQSFTDALHTIEDWKGAPKVAGTDQDIKILYGCEGYYVNDVDDTLVVRGNKDMPLDGEYVAFDLETTGLRPRFDTIIEIGAVRMKNGEELERFQSFVDPGVPLRQDVVQLTGITDEMLRGAPKLEEVLPQFMEFVGDSVLVAHNAEFDTCYIRRNCQALGLACNITSLDTLTLAQNLMPTLGKHKLDVVAKEFDLGDFEHHRAADDALICGKIAARLFEMLRQRDIHTLQSINEAMLPLRPEYKAEDVHAQHIILFAKNQQGLRNLYHLISDSNLKFFKKKPRIFKSQLFKLR